MLNNNNMFIKKKALNFKSKGLIINKILLNIKLYNIIKKLSIKVKNIKK